MKRFRIYACQGCARSIYRSNRTDRKKYCPECAARAVADCARSRAQAARERRGENVIVLPGVSPDPFKGAA